jgi:hypothetical protein
MVVVIFADFIGDMLGQACIMFVAILFVIGWLASKLGRAAGNALKNEKVQDAAKVGFWMWFFSDD